MEGEEPEEETEGYTLLKYMERMGNNQFVWGSGKDTLKTINKDILCVRISTSEVKAPLGL